MKNFTYLNKKYILSFVTMKKNFEIGIQKYTLYICKT